MNEKLEFYFATRHIAWPEEGSSETKVVKEVEKFFDLCAGIVFQEQLTGICVCELLPETVQTPGGYYSNEFSGPCLNKNVLSEYGI